MLPHFHIRTVIFTPCPDDYYSIHYSFRFVKGFLKKISDFFLHPEQAAPLRDFPKIFFLKNADRLPKMTVYLKSVYNYPTA